MSELHRHIEVILFLVQLLRLQNYTRSKEMLFC